MFVCLVFQPRTKQDTFRYIYTILGGHSSLVNKPKIKAMFPLKKPSSIYFASGLSPWWTKRTTQPYTYTYIGQDRSMFNVGTTKIALKNKNPTTTYKIKIGILNRIVVLGRNGQECYWTGLCWARNWWPLKFNTILERFIEKFQAWRIWRRFSGECFLR